jgi:hypothetical protein
MPGSDQWRPVFESERELLLRLNPATGKIGGSSTVQEPLMVDARFGRSQLCTPAVLRIFVDDEERAVSPVGRLVKRALFPHHPPFVFNTVACVGQAQPQRLLGAYTNPGSPWFNVFFGYYQLDSPKSDWARPFGYRSADGVTSDVEIEDVIRLGKSDWNYFSNWMYGVPQDRIEPYNEVELSTMPAHVSTPERIGTSLWHPLLIDDVEVASTYESDAPGAARLEEHTPLVEIWRHAFGLPNPQPEWTESFIPTRLRAAVWMAYREGEEAFHTTIFGATLPAGGEEAFLAAQLATVRTAMERSYPGLGFAA